MTDSYVYFLAGFRHLMESWGHGGQVRLASLLQISAKHINDILKQRSRAGKKLQQAIAQCFSLSLEQMFVLGKGIVEKKSPCIKTHSQKKMGIGREELLNLRADLRFEMRRELKDLKELLAKRCNELEKKIGEFEELIVKLKLDIEVAEVSRFDTPSAELSYGKIDLEIEAVGS